MECYVDDPAQIVDEIRYKARKIHNCCECGNEIKINEYYFKTSILYDGEWHHYKQCERCNEVMDIAIQAGVCPYMEQLFDCIKEVFFDIEEKYQNYFKKMIGEYLPDYYFSE